MPRALKAVASGMVGIRRGKQAQLDSAELKLWHVAAAGLTLIAAFVAALVTLARYIAG